jgi:cytochrome b subunit of formate dehydrogenase
MRRLFSGDDMEVFGGFMVMMSIIGLFLAVVWLIMPFVVFAIKGKQDRTLELLEAMEKRLASIEAQLVQQQVAEAVCRSTETASERDLSDEEKSFQASASPLA